MGPWPGRPPLEARHVSRGRRDGRTMPNSTSLSMMSEGFCALAIRLGLTTRQRKSMTASYPSVGSDLGSML